MVEASFYQHGILGNNAADRTNDMENNTEKPKRKNVKKDWEVAPPAEAELCYLPDKYEWEQELLEYDQQIEDCKKGIAGIHSRLEELKTRRSALQAQNKELSAARKTIRGRKDKIFDQLNASSEKINALKKAKNDGFESLKDMKKALPFDSTEEINREIRSIENRISSENMSIRDEKFLISKIKSLNAKKNEVREYEVRQAAFQSKTFPIKELTMEREAIKKMVDVVKAEDHDNYELIKALKGSIKEVSDKIKALMDERTELQDSMNGLYEEKKEAINENRRAVKAYYKYKEWAEYNKWLQRKQEREEQAAYREEQEKIRAAEEALRDPYEEEKTLCDSLKVYFQSLLPVESTDNNKTSSKKTCTISSSVSGDDELFATSKASVNSLKKKKKKKSKSSSTLVHSPDVFQQCSVLKLTPPALVEEIGAVLEKIEGLVEYYQTAPHPKEMKNAKAFKETLDKEIEERRERAAESGAMYDEEKSRLVKEAEEELVQECVERQNIIEEVVASMEGERQRRVNEEQFCDVISEISRTSNQKMAIELMEAEKELCIAQDKHAETMNELQRRSSIPLVENLEEEERARKVTEHDQLFKDSSEFRKVLQDSVPSSGENTPQQVVEN